MRAGDLRDLIQILAPVRAASNSLGEREVSWTPIGDPLPAEVTPINAAETVRARTAGLDTTHRVKLRYTPDLSPEKTDRAIRYTDAIGNEVTIQITSIIDIENRHVELQITGVSRG